MGGGGEGEFRDSCVHLCLWCIQELKPGSVEGGGRPFCWSARGLNAA